MRKNLRILAVALSFLTIIGFEACSPAKGDHPGSEYMPDMGHSIAYEANVITEYYHNTWDAESKKHSGKTVRELSLHNKPVKGTIPRGYAGVVNANNKDRAAKMKFLRGESSTNAMAIPLNGKVPYYIPNTEEGRTYAATAPELRNNPFPITEKGLKEGKELYEIYCGICHGNKGDGNGYLVADENKNVKYLSGPTDYLTDELIDAENGRYYHTIMYGKGVMGSYKDKLSYKERWNVIHYIRALQAKKRELAYSQYENTLNSWAVPAVDTDLAIEDAIAADKSGLVKGFNNVLKDTTDSYKSTLLKLNNVFFDTGKATLKPESKLELNVIAALLQQNESAKIKIDGHTDSTGEPTANQALSEARANAVKNYLLGKGIAVSRLQAEGFGQTQPHNGNMSSNLTEEGKALNRRTEMSVISK